MNRTEALKWLRATVAQGCPIVGGGAGTGITAQAEAESGADIIIVYGTGKYRMAGRSSMAGRFAFGNANQIVYEMASEVMHVVGDTPVVAGVALQDPFRDMKRFFAELIEVGYSGIQNIPGMGGMEKMEGREAVELLDAAGIGLEKEMEHLRVAQQMGLLTTPYAYDLDQAVRLSAIGADMVCLHVGLTAKGLMKTAHITPLEVCAENLAEWVRVIRSENPDTIILCHGGPISEPEDFHYIMQHVPGIAGFYGASSIERIPVEKAFLETIGAFRSLRFNRAG